MLKIKSVIVFVLLVLSNALLSNDIEFTSKSFAGLPIFIIDGDANICQKYGYAIFRRLQAVYGIQVANSALHCKFETVKNEKSRRAYIGIDPKSKCGLQIRNTIELIDPCSGKIYSAKGECLSDSCHQDLIQIFYDATSTIDGFLLPNTELIEFSDLTQKKQLNVNAQLALAMLTNSDVTIGQLLANATIDVNFVSANGMSLVELAIITHKNQVLKYLIERKAVICKDCRTSQELLLNSLKSGAFKISKLLYDYGVSTTLACKNLENHIDGRSIIECDR